jgi:hypothetical protein
MALVVLSACCISTWTLSAAEAPNTFRQSLSQAAPADLPPKAAALVKAAKTRDREDTTIKVITAALEVNPAAAPAIVGAIARMVPDAAATAAGTAAALQPKQAAAIARAAAAAAPSKAAKIVEAVSRAVPTEYRGIALAVGEINSISAKAVVEGLAAAQPAMKPSLESGLAHFGGNPPSVQALLDYQATSTTTTPGSALPASGLSGFARGPALGPPYIPLSGTPNNLNPGNSGNVPPGGRDYARP